jgi:hypothetical protein
MEENSSLFRLNGWWFSVAEGRAYTIEQRRDGNVPRVLKSSRQKLEYVGSAGVTFLTI